MRCQMRPCTTCKHQHHLAVAAPDRVCVDGPERLFKTSRGETFLLKKPMQQIRGCDKQQQSTCRGQAHQQRVPAVGQGKQGREITYSGQTQYGESQVQMCKMQSMEKTDQTTDQLLKGTVHAMEQISPLGENRKSDSAHRALHDGLNRE